MSDHERKSLWNLLTAKSVVAHHTRRQPSLRRNRLRFEALEDRRMLATLWVDPNVAASGNIYANIQLAEDAAHSGDTIKVVAGTYTAGADVFQSLTIIGGQVRVSGEPVGPSIIFHPGSGSFNLETGGITIEDFTFKGGAFGINTSSTDSGFNILNNTFLDDTTGVGLNTLLTSSAKTSTISGNTFTYDTGPQPTDSIFTDIGVRNVTISNNTFFADDTDAAVKIDGTSQSSNVQILNNRIVFDNGFVIANATKSKIDDNTIIGFSNTAVELAGGVTNSEAVGNNLAFAATSPPYGIVLNTVLDPSSDTNNKISGNTIRGFYVGIELVAADHNTVSGNTVLDSANDGIQLTDSSSTFNTISSNSVAHSGENGIDLFATSDNNTLSENMVNSSGKFGIQIASNDNTVSKNSFNNNTFSGVFLDDATGNSLSGNTISENGDAGVVAEGATMNTFSGNTANSNASDGFALESASNQNKLTGNTANSNTNGFFLDESSSNTLSSNKALANANIGFEAADGSMQNTFSGDTANGNFEAGFEMGGGSNTVTKNTANDNLDDGFDIQGDSSTIMGNTANSNQGAGFHLSSGNGDTISGNTATGNGEEGFFLNAITNSTFSGNTAKGNADDGIYVDSSGNTISGNTASGNGQALGGFDLFDSTTGGTGTAGTKNTWSKNKATTRSPAGLG